MSEKKEHKKRYNLRLMYIAEFDRWLDREPPRMFWRAWHNWKKQRPTFAEICADAIAEGEA